MKKIYIITVIYILITIKIFSLKIFIADLNFIQDNPDVVINDKEKNTTELLLKKIKEKDFDGLLDIRVIPKTIAFENRLIKSNLDASEICDILNIDYLIYGFIEKSNKFYNAEIRLFENSTKSDKKIFYIKTEIVTIEEVVDEISYKFVSYMVKELGLTDYQKERKVGFGGFGISTGIGYFFAIGDWRDIFTAIICCDLGFLVLPVNHIVKKRNFSFYIRIGLSADYLFGISNPGYLKSYFNFLLFKIPVIISFELFFYHVINIGIAPQLHLSVVYQEKLFDDPVVYTTAAAGLTIFLSYEYWIGKRKFAAIGLNNSFDFSFYKTMYYDYKIELYTIVRIPLIKGEKK